MTLKAGTPFVAVSLGVVSGTLLAVEQYVGVAIAGALAILVTTCRRCHPR
jgi:hypothetical protein